MFASTCYATRVVRLAFGALFLTVACTASSSSIVSSSSEVNVCAADAPRTAPIELSVWPEAGEVALTDVLDGATSSVRMMVYMLGKDATFASLKERAAAGVDVRVILDGGAKKAFNTPAYDALTAAGVKVQWSDPRFAFMHAKSFVVDDRVAVIATGNFPRGLIAKERNYVARDRDLYDVQTLAAIFDADWDKREPDVACTRLLVSPVNSKDKLLAEMDRARTSLLVESLELSDRDVIAKILAKKAAGLDVRVLLADPTWSAENSNARTARTLDEHGVETRTIPKERMLVHVKSIVVDGTSAYMGSENFTAGSFGRNREIGLIVDDAPVLATMSGTFEADFASAAPL